MWQLDDFDDEARATPWRAISGFPEIAPSAPVEIARQLESHERRRKRGRFKRFLPRGKYHPQRSDCSNDDLSFNRCRSVTRNPLFLTGSIGRAARTIPLWASRIEAMRLELWPHLGQNDRVGSVSRRALAGKNRRWRC